MVRGLQKENADICYTMDKVTKYFEKLMTCTFGDGHNDWLAKAGMCLIATHS